MTKVKKYIKEKELAEKLGWEIHQREEGDMVGHKIRFYFEKKNKIIWHTGYRRGSLVNNSWGMTENYYENKRYSKNLENILLMES